MNKRLFKLKGKTLAIIDWANVYGWFDHLKWEIDLKKLYHYLKSYPEIYNIRFYFGLEKGNRTSERIHEKTRNIGYTLIWKEVKWVPVSLERSHFKQLYRNINQTINTIHYERIQRLINSLSILNEKTESALHSVRMGFLPETGDFKMVKPIFKIEELRELAKVMFKLKEELLKLDFSLQSLKENLSQPILRRKCDFDVEITKDILLNLDQFDGLILFSGDGDYATLMKELIKRKKQTIVVALKGAMGKEYTIIPDGLYICNIKKLKEFIQK